ncbi:MAG: hypothetical protein R2867_09625 [Caldilineaceae bacterium]
MGLVLKIPPELEKEITVPLIFACPRLREIDERLGEIMAGSKKSGTTVNLDRRQRARPQCKPAWG